MIKTKCPQCKKEFETHPYRLKTAKRVFCSRQCMSEGYKLPPDVVHRNKLESSRRWRKSNRHKQLEYRQANKERIKELSKKNYERNKEKYLARAKKRLPERMKLYRESKKMNLWENIQVTKRTHKKRFSDPDWRNKVNEEGRRLYEAIQSETLDKASLRFRKWTEGEIEYLRDNHAKKTYLEMAFELNRTYSGIKAAILRFNIGRKNRVLQNLFDKSRDEIF